MKPLFFENELPVDDLSRIGLWKDGKAVLSPEDLRAMLTGRRTGLLTLENVQADGFLIKRLDVKLSLHRSESGQVSLQAHPIHHEIQSHPLLTEKDMKLLTEGKVASIGKTVNGADGKAQQLIFEYDAGTKEFVSYIPSQVQAPERVNGELLTQQQKEAFQSGKPVELSDGTTFQHRASEPNGILSDRIALVVSVLMDGGITYLLLRGLRNLLGEKKPQKDEYTAGFKMALAAMERQQAQKDLPNLDQQERTYGPSRSR
jgi:hypothetical protein